MSSRLITFDCYWPWFRCKPKLLMIMLSSNGHTEPGHYWRIYWTLWIVHYDFCDSLGIPLRIPLRITFFEDSFKDRSYHYFLTNHRILSESAPSSPRASLRPADLNRHFLAQWGRPVVKMAWNRRCTTPMNCKLVTGKLSTHRYG